MSVAMFASDQSEPTALFDGGLQLADLLAHRRVDLVRAFVGVREPRLDELERRVVARVAELDRAVDVAAVTSFLICAKNSFEFTRYLRELERDALDDHRDDDRAHDQVDGEEGRVLFEGVHQAVSLPPAARRRRRRIQESPTNIRMLLFRT